MRTRTSLPATISSALLLLPLSTFAALFTGEFEADGVKLSFKELKTHSVVWERKEPPSVDKTTWTVNPLGKIEVDSDKKDSQCPDGTQVCGVSYLWHDDKPDEKPHRVIPVANIETSKTTEPEYKIVRNDDKKVKGLDVTLHGPPYGDSKTNQKAIIHFICDADKTGNETPDKDGKGENALKFIDYKEKSTLELEWRTKWACENAEQAPPESKGSWGFFTWFIVIVFLVVAAYLIFGSWLNYNKYGARGWDLLPHSDTLRDLPYLVKDFMRRAVNTFQGSSGGRGGYSAV